MLKNNFPDARLLPFRKHRCFGAPNPMLKANISVAPKKFPWKAFGRTEMVPKMLATVTASVSSTSPLLQELIARTCSPSHGVLVYDFSQACCASGLSRACSSQDRLDSLAHLRRMDCLADFFPMLPFSTSTQPLPQRPRPCTTKIGLFAHSSARVTTFFGSGLPLLL